ncbi:MAG TPA: DedA family protein [Minicystis sp.]|nr:DedA family protein [Minicystis sp.]
MGPAPLFLSATFDGLVQNWMTTGGYFALFALLFSCGLGLPVPEDVPLLAAGVMIANGKMSLPVAGVVAWCGIIGGDICLYHLGKRFGLNITKVPFVGKHVTKRRIERAEELFAKYGVLVVAVGRMFAGIRGAMVVAAGTIRFKLVRFLIADGLAALVSGGLFLLLGRWLGDRLKEHMEEINRYKAFFFIGAIVLAAIVFAVSRIRRKRREALEAIEEREAARRGETVTSASP